MAAVKAGDWLAGADAARAFGMTAARFRTLAGIKNLKTRLGPGGVREFRISDDFLTKHPLVEEIEQARQPTPAASPEAVRKPPFEALAGMADLLAEDLRRETAEHSTRGDGQAAAASRCAAVVMDNLSVLIRTADEHLSESQKDQPDVR